VLFWAALSHRVYHFTVPYRRLYYIFGEEGTHGTFAVSTLLRKLYSVVGFAVIGFVVDRALPPSRRPALRAAAIVAGFSAVIEVAQKVDGATEGLLSNAIDVLCGAAGGWLAVAPFRRRRR
jgi:hypothetical protein